MMIAMDPAKAIDLAANKVGGISELGRQLKWNKGSIAATKAGTEKLSARRAAQLAKIIGGDPLVTYLEALHAKAAFDDERALIAQILKKVR